MAMFLSRIKKALNLGTKNITVNGTYNASSDGYDGYSSVEVNVAGVTPTPVTPSNASPAALTSGTAVSPTANGYAIESYSEVEPSYDHDVSLSIGNIYKASLSGKFVPNVINITPTNASPVTLRYPYVYRNIAEYGGVAIGGYVDKTPSDDNPPAVVSGAIYKASASGYLYSTQQPKVKQGIITGISTSDPVREITCGFKPKFIYAVYRSNTSPVSGTKRYIACIYDENVSTLGACFHEEASMSWYTFPSTSTYHINSITDTGFKINRINNSAYTQLNYFAIG